MSIHLVLGLLSIAVGLVLILGRERIVARAHARRPGKATAHPNMFAVVGALMLLNGVLQLLRAF